MYSVHTISKKETKVGQIEVKKAKYLDGYRLLIAFSDGYKSEVDFSDFLLPKRGYLAKYKDPKKFQKFKVENGNLVWGKNWDLIFPVDELYNGHIK